MTLKQFLNSTKKGIVKGLTVQVLPAKINNFYKNPFVRVIRVIGGTCLFLCLTDKHLVLPFPLQCLVLSLGLIQIVHMFIFYILNSYYTMKKLRNNPELFEVKNSPIDLLAGKVAKLITCWSRICNAASGGLSLVGAGLMIDQFLEAGGQEKICLPYLSSLIFKQNPNNLVVYSDEIKKQVEILKTIEKEGKLIQNIDKILSKEALEQLGISLPESEEIRSSVLEAVKANEEDKKEIAKKIVDITKNIKK